jgi:hypothetical protein
MLINLKSVTDCNALDAQSQILAIIPRITKKPTTLEGAVGLCGASAARVSTTGEVLPELGQTKAGPEPWVQRQRVGVRFRNAPTEPGQARGGRGR